jgi:NADPH:quinone reductase-like Zn-dependent oxidoreductase
LRAFAFDDYAVPGSIHELADPQPGDGEVRIRIAAASINPFDNFLVQGYMKERMPLTFPFVACGDLSGTVDQVGAGVEGLAPGDPVFGVLGWGGKGTLAELALAKPDTLARRPGALDDRAAAALPLAGVSALMSVEAAGVKPGDVVVVIGASGGIGGYAVQLAALLGAHVVGVTSSSRVDYVKGLGAAEVIDRTAGDVVAAIKSRHRDGVDVLIDTMSDAAGMAHTVTVVKQGGVATSMRGAAQAEELAKHGVKGVNIQTQVTTERLEHLATLSVEGKLKAPMIHGFPLAGANEGFKSIGKTGGKIVITIG